MEEYKEKLRAFCAALQYPNVEETIEKSPEEFQAMGEMMVKVIEFGSQTIDLLTTEVLNLKNKKD